MLNEKTIEILKNSKKIAVIGCSTNPAKPAHQIPKYLQSVGFQIIPINPRADEILGVKSYPSIDSINFEFDILDVFRPSDEVLDIVKQVIKLENKPKLIWMQSGIINEEASNLAKENGIEVVMDKCIMAEHKNL